jgi:glycosyltransferase involved in cell wall biosynthesis
MVRVLFIVNSLRPGGAEKHVVSLVNHLDVREFRMTLACLHPGADLLHEIGSDRLVAAISCNVKRKLDWKVVGSLADLIDSAEIDVVFCTNLYAMLYGTLARARAKRRPRLVEVFHTTLLGSWRLRAQMVFYWPLFRQCDRLVYVCENQRLHWRRLGLRAMADTRVYNGIDTEHFAPAPVAIRGRQLREELGFTDGDFVVGICAGLRSEKAHGDLLSAIARLRAGGMPARCLIIGDGPERPWIERRIVELGLQSDAFIVGFRSDVRPYVAACDVMALVSRAVETFSISALEAMAMERPMVMSRIGGAAEQVADGVNGYTFSAGNVSELTECLKMLANPAVRAGMGKSARAVVVERFGVATMTRSYEEMLRSLVNSSHG